MAWHFPDGIGTISCPIADLFVASIASAFDLLLEEVEENADQREYGIPAFDRLGWGSRLALLIEVGEATTRGDVPCPALTCVREAAIGAIWENVHLQLDLEIDACREDWPPEYDAWYWRRAVIACCPTELDGETVPDDHCLDSKEWHDVVDDYLVPRMLWDDDWLDEDFHDMEPSQAAALKRKLDIPADYYSSIPPDPAPGDLVGLILRANALTTRAGEAPRHYVEGFVPDPRKLARLAEARAAQ